MVEFKRASPEDGQALQDLLAELPEPTDALSDDDCRSALDQAESLLNALVREHEDQDGRLWMDVPGAMDVLAATQSYLNELRAQLLRRGLISEANRTVPLLDRAGDRLAQASETYRRAADAINEHIQEGQIVIPSRKTQAAVRRLLREGHQS